MSDYSSADVLTDRDLKKLMKVLVPCALESLCNEGVVRPFGAKLNTSGDVLPSLNPAHGRGEKDLELLTGEFQQDAAQRSIRAAGLCCEINHLPSHGSEPLHAIQYSLEHEGGMSVEALQPYKIDKIGGVIELGLIVVKSRTPRIFVERDFAMMGT